MQIEQIEMASSSLNQNEKIDLIKSSLLEIGDDEQIEKENLADAKDRDDLEKKMNKWIEDIIPGSWFENGVKFLTVPITKKVLELYDNFVNEKIGNISDFIETKFADIQSIFSDNLNIQDLKIKHFVDTVYSVGYSFDKNGSSYTIIKPDGNIVIDELNSPLEAINKKSNLVDSLDEVLVERSFTGQGLDIKEMALILQTVGINPENPESIEKIRPKLLAKAYLHYYAKKLGYSPVPELDKPMEITNFLNDPKVKLKIPNERVTYIKLVEKNAFGSDLNDSTEHDTDILRNSLSEFYKVHELTTGKLAAAKEAASNVGNMLKEGIPGLMKYMNGPEGLIIAAGLVYALFFSDFKKKAWLGILGFSGLNVLTKAYNQDNNKGIVDVLAGGIENVVGQEVKLPIALTGLEQDEWLKDDNNSKVNTISIISSVNFDKLMKETEIKNDNTIEIKNFTIFSAMDIKELEKIWPSGDYKLQVNRLLKQFIEKTADNTGTTDKSLEEKKEALVQKYKNPKYDKPRLSYVIADILLWKVTSSPLQSTIGIPVDSNQQNHTESIAQLPIIPSLNILPTPVELDKYRLILRDYSSQNPSKETILTLFSREKSKIIQELKSISGNTNQDIIDKLILELKK